MHTATEAIGMMASLTSFLLWLPQGARVWKHRRDPAGLRGIVLSTQVISLLGNALWGVYALLIGSFWLGAPSLVNGPIAVATIVVVVRSQAASARACEPAAGGATTATVAAATATTGAAATVATTVRDGAPGGAGKGVAAAPVATRRAGRRELVAA